MTTVDSSARFQPLRQQIAAEGSGGYLRFVGELSPRYARAWRDLALGYGSLALVICVIGLPESSSGRLLAALLGAVAVGYGVAYLQLFLHEAAHFNLARDRQWNDRLCDALVSWQVGTTVARYRPVHFAHHRYLGTSADTENSYFHALGPRLIVETLTGVHALRILAQRDRQLEKARGWGPLLRGLMIHSIVMVAAWVASGWPGVFAWVVGVGAFYPLFATLRQLLEHRATEAHPAVDYRTQDHGAVTRLFGTGLLASTFGGAGFNRHLLHHWEPQVSYTRLAELERHLRGTCAGTVVAARRSTYLGTLRALWCASQRSRPAETRVAP